MSPNDRLFYECFLEAGLVQIVDSPTITTSGNILDLCLVSNTESVFFVDVVQPLPNCAHSPVILGLILPDLASSHDTGISARLWSKGNYNNMCRDLDCVNWHSLFEDKNVEECYKIFIDVYAELVDRYVPSKSSKTPSNWAARPPRSLLRKRKDAWNTYTRARKEFGRNHAAAEEALAAFNEVNHEYRSYSLAKQCDHELSLVQCLSENPKKFHAYIRRKKKGNPPVGPLKVNGAVISDPKDMSEELASYFGSVFNPSTTLVREEHQTCNARMIPPNITYNDVFDALKTLNSTSSPGLDEVHPHVLKSCASSLALPLTLIFIKSLRISCLPLL